ncbi:MAG: galactose-1-phosphate uridylyltransferase [Patescibacteria group bacterium]
MSEFRQNIVTKEWVLIAPNRSARPNDFRQGPAVPEDAPEFLDRCVFCPGNEKSTPPQIASNPSGSDWQVRVVPNKFGLLELNQGRPERNFYIRLPGVGSHEVLITRYHNQPTALQSVDLVDLTLKVYIERIKELEGYETVKYVHIIQNHGKLAGASLLHPHSQIFAMPFLGPHTQSEFSGSHRHYDIYDSCVYCEIIRHELGEKKRIVLETDRYLVVCPFESKMPFQMRIMPKIHEANFQALDDAERYELAAVLKASLSKLYSKLGNPAYNYYIHTMPFSRSKNIAHNDKAYHWHLVILPRINIWAGLELGTEIYVNLMPPEQAAEFLAGDAKE